MILKSSPQKFDKVISLFKNLCCESRKSSKSDRRLKDFAKVEMNVVPNDNKELKMRSNLIWVLAVAGLTLILSASCTKKPVKTDEAGAQGSGDMSQTAGQGAPAVVEKPIETDPLGSDSGKIQGLNTVHFEYDKDRLTAESKKQLSENAEWIKGHANFTIQVEGHTDARGSVEYNLALGERRAKSVKNFLQGLGIDPKRVTIISYGKEKPVDNADGEAAWGKNRRANFVPLQ